MKMYLYEGLNKQDRASVMLWESAGRKLVEAQLTADQITQLFQQIQTAKGNRTLVGKGVDAGGAVAKAYNDLKTKISTSGPIQNMDALYDQAAEKLKQATGGDQGAMSYVQKYRDFAKKHPIAQSFIYGALIAAAGITGAGAGGAAALGLFKMVDKLLQGEKFSSAAYSGAKTGAMAYAAGQIGKAIKGDQAPPGAPDLKVSDTAKDIAKEFDPTKYDYVGDGLNLNVYDKAGQLVKQFDASGEMLSGNELLAQVQELTKLDQIGSGIADTATNVAGNVNSMTVGKGALSIFKDKVANGLVSDHNSYVKAISDSLRQAGGDQLKTQSYKAAQQTLEMSIKGAVSRAAGGEFSGDNTQMLAQVIKTFGGTVDPAALAKDVAATAAQASGQTFESRNLSHKQVLALFERVARLNNRMLTEGRLEEGIWDDVKSGAGKGLQGIKSLAGKAGSAVAKGATAVGGAVAQGAGKALGAVAQGAAKVGRSMTANVSSDALTKAWQAAGSPTDSAEIEKLLQTQGVNPQVIKTVFQANKIPVTPTAPVGQDAANDPTVDAMPDVMAPGGNRPEQGAMAQGVQQAQGGQQPQQPAQQQPQQAQGGQPQAQQPQAQGGQQQPRATASKLPDVSKLTPEQKKQLLAQIDQRLASLPAPTQPAQPQTQQPAPTQQPQPQVQQPAPTQTAQPQNAEPEQPADLFAEPTATPDLKVSPAPKAGLPTPDEQAKYQEKLKAADQTQNKTTTVGAPTPDEQAKLQAKLKAADQAQNKTKPAPKELAESYEKFKFLVDGIKARI